MFILNYTHKSTFVPKPPKTKIKSERKNNKKQQWLQPFWNTNSLAGDGYPFLLRPFFDLSWNVRGWVIFRWTFPALQVKWCQGSNVRSGICWASFFVRFWKFWWIFVLGPSNSTVCAWHYGLRVLVFVLRDSEQKLQIVVMETVIRFGKIVVTPWRIEFVLFFLVEKLKGLKWNKELITLDYRLQGYRGCRSSQHHVFFQTTLRRSSGRENDHVLWCGWCQSRWPER